MPFGAVERCVYLHNYAVQYFKMLSVENKYLVPYEKEDIRSSGTGDGEDVASGRSKGFLKMAGAPLTNLSVCYAPVDITGMQSVIMQFMFQGQSPPTRRQEKTVMKLLVDAETDKVLGASMRGPDTPEIMQVGIHPSAAEEFVTMQSVTRRVSPVQR
ncbi:hypothetical protein F0562_022420 [Nyssa sinensis]|uniref:Pyridine nucleotide-disulphide oxidoreductase dimerisation domain-containing protein n=1 Tax=Nyssa sinensis TaxID=561372 RepID=A0A5J5BNP6_9ASTE|nr:hypothetical protein F0562_022420 [Nyssa sinensis]